MRLKNKNRPLQHNKRHYGKMLLNSFQTNWKPIEPPWTACKQCHNKVVFNRYHECEWLLRVILCETPLKQGSKITDFVLNRVRVWRPWRHTTTQTSLKCSPPGGLDVPFVLSNEFFFLINDFMELDLKQLLVPTCGDQGFQSRKIPCSRREILK